MLIIGKDNKKIKLLKSLDSKKNRDEKNLFVIESIKLIKEAVLEKIELEFVLISENLLNKDEIKKLILLLEDNNIAYHTVLPDLFSSTVSTVTSQGAIAVARKRNYTSNFLAEESKMIIFLDELQDPGNLGTIIRTADAFGPCEIVLSPKCVDVYNEKTVRSCAGALFRVPITTIDDSILFLEALKQEGFKLVSTVVDSDNDFDNLGEFDKICLIIGNEGKGVSKEIKNISDEKVTIKMSGRTESLNASTAATICIYEIRKKLL